jgi:hypothetical protein
MNAKNDAARAERLKAALRDNLRRRKAQGRGRAETAPENIPENPSEDTAGTSPESPDASAGPEREPGSDA